MTTTPRKPFVVLVPPVLRFRDSTPALVVLPDWPPRMNHGLIVSTELAFAPDHPEVAENIFIKTVVEADRPPGLLIRSIPIAKMTRFFNLY